MLIPWSIETRQVTEVTKAACVLLMEKLPISVIYQKTQAH
jgi:hypothetical protein